jgi:hypothetical protein
VADDALAQVEGVVLVGGGGAGAVGAAVGVEGGVVEEDGAGAGVAPVGGDGAVGVFFALRWWGGGVSRGLGRRGRGVRG